MPEFHGSGFSIDLPADSVDASAYCFSFPALGDFSPNLTIRFQRCSSPPELGQVMARHHEALQSGVESFKVLSEGAYKWGAADYVVSVAEWGEGGNAITQKQVFLFVPTGLATLYSMTATDLSANFARSEAALDAIMGSFKVGDLV